MQGANEEDGTDVQEFDEVQEDGSVVRRKITTTREQQLNTEKIVLEGDVSIDEDEDNAECSGVVDGSPRHFTERRFVSFGFFINLTENNLNFFFHIKILFIFQLFRD